MERCPRGRRGTTGNRVSRLKRDRGFESLSLRHEPRRVRGSRAPYMVHGAMDYALHKVHGSLELNVVQGARLTNLYVLCLRFEKSA